MQLQNGKKWYHCDETLHVHHTSVKKHYEIYKKGLNLLTNH